MSIFWFFFFSITLSLLSQYNKQDVVLGGLNGPGEKKNFPSNVGKSLCKSNEKRASLSNSPITFIS